ncbi:MAG: hypothetical protein NVSMB43_23190 [Pseudarthrobacter sp.]
MGTTRLPSPAVTTAARDTFFLTPLRDELARAREAEQAQPRRPTRPSSPGHDPGRDTDRGRGL